MRVSACLLQNLFVRSKFARTFAGCGEGEVARGGDSVMGHWMGNYDGSNFYQGLTTRILTPKIVQVLETGNIEFSINGTILDEIMLSVSINCHILLQNVT